MSRLKKIEEDDDDDSLLSGLVPAHQPQLLTTTQIIFPSAGADLYTVLTSALC